MAEKTYKSVQPRLSMYRFDAKGKKVPIQFTPHLHGGPHGEFTTADPDTQKHIETRDAFKSCFITVKSAAEHETDADAAEAKIEAGAKHKEKYEAAHAKRATDRAAQQAADKVVQKRNTAADTARDAAAHQHKAAITEAANVAKKKADLAAAAASGKPAPAAPPAVEQEKPKEPAAEAETVH